jgi:UDP-N-acetylmuramoylalanine--D-glutamate ligase
MASSKNNSFRLFEQEREYANPMVATLANRLIDIRKKDLAASLSDFEGSAHKLQKVKTLNQIDFIDDARSTNTNSVWYSLQSMTKPVIWISNVDNAEKITNDLMDQIGEKVKCVVLQGVYNTDVYDRLAELGIPVYVEMNMEDAVSQAYYACDKGYAVLYAPGAAGTNGISYREKGDQFQNAVAQL